MVMRTMYRRKPAQGSHSPIAGPLQALEAAFQEAEMRTVETYRRGMLPTRPTLIEHGPLRILISATPSPSSLESYADTLAYYNVKHVVRVCEPTYDADVLRDLGFAVHEWHFGDGESPPETVVSNWLSLLDHVFKLSAHRQMLSPGSTASDTGSDSDVVPSGSADKPCETVALHCVAGLGRAPVLAAIALVELGLEPYEAVGWIRALRRGAVNARQMAFVESYARRPPPSSVKPQRTSRSRSGSFVGAFWPSLKAARPFRPRSPRQSRDSPRGTNTPPSSGRHSPAPSDTSRH